jgi:hypothetical protein
MSAYVSEEHVASTYRVEEWAKQETIVKQNAVWSCRRLKFLWIGKTARQFLYNLVVWSWNIGCGDNFTTSNCSITCENSGSIKIEFTVLYYKNRVYSIVLLTSLRIHTPVFFFWLYHIQIVVRGQLGSVSRTISGWQTLLSVIDEREKYSSKIALRQILNDKGTNSELWVSATAQS